MAVEILVDDSSGRQVLICNTTDVAFGPVFNSDELANEFLEWLKKDPRDLTQMELSHKVGEWRELSYYAKNDLPIFIASTARDLVEDFQDGEEGENGHTFKDVEIIIGKTVVGYADISMMWTEVRERETRDNPARGWVEDMEIDDLVYRHFDHQEELVDLTEGQNKYLLKRVKDEM